MRFAFSYIMFQLKMYLSIGAIFLVVYALSTVQCSTYFARAVDDFDDNGDSAGTEKFRKIRTPETLP